MIAASAILVVVALISLIVGVFSTGLGMIYVSIASSALAALTLFVGVQRDKRKAALVGEGAGSVVPVQEVFPAAESDLPEMLAEVSELEASTLTAEAPLVPDLSGVEAEADEAPFVSARARTTTRKPTARPKAGASARAAASKPAAKRPAAKAKSPSAKTAASTGKTASKAAPKKAAAPKAVTPKAATPKATTKKQPAKAAAAKTSAGKTATKTKPASKPAARTTKKA